MIIVAIAAAGLLGGCGSSPKASFYTLAPDATLASTGNTAPVRVVIGPVTVPDLIDRPQIVTRAAGSRVDIDEFARWAEPLKTDIARVIAADLGRLLGSAQVNVFDAGAGAAPACARGRDALRFDAGRFGHNRRAVDDPAAGEVGRGDGALGRVRAGEGAGLRRARHGARPRVGVGEPRYRVGHPNEPDSMRADRA
ncbi:PqiC family protein [Burkholderia aenigmatica]|uniref:PqiC family protein n=1 Tax=Burkholderia aenigmatica TaxID=2015348 RepID=UPI003C6C7EF3